jgi:hypothetical protein
VYYIGNLPGRSIYKKKNIVSVESSWNPVLFTDIGTTESFPNDLPRLEMEMLNDMLNPLCSYITKIEIKL